MGRFKSSSWSSSHLMVVGICAGLSISTIMLFKWRKKIKKERDREERCRVESPSSTSRPALTAHSEWLSQSGREVLSEIVDAFIPEVPERDLEEYGLQLLDDAVSSFCPNFLDCVSNTSINNSILEDPAKRAFLSRGARAMGVSEAICEGIGKLVLPEDRSKLALLLFLLGTSVGNAFLTGYPMPFQHLPLIQRETALRRLRDARTSDLRASYQTLRRLTGSLFAGYPFEVAGGDRANPNWQALAYSPSESRKRTFKNKAVSVDKKIPKPLLQTNENSVSTFTADVIVIGSGAGGGTVSAQLVRAGYTVLVLEKGPYLTTEQFQSWSEVEAMQAAYERGGLCSTEDANIVILAGSCVGGGTTVNWSASFRTPDYVRREWAYTMPEQFGDGKVFEKALDTAHELFSVNTEYCHRDVEETDSHLHRQGCSAQESQQGFAKNINNEILIRGAKSQGYYPEVIARNTVGNVYVHICILCNRSIVFILLPLF